MIFPGSTENEVRFLVETIFRQDVYMFQHRARHGYDYIVDVGANFGLFSLRAFSYFPNATRVAVEPAPTVFKALQYNLGFTGIHCVEGALSLSKKLRMQQMNSDAQITAASIALDSPTGDVSGVTLTELFNKFNIDPRRTWLKLDCEGGESVCTDKREAELIMDCRGLSAEVHLHIGTGWQDSWLKLEEKIAHRAEFFRKQMYAQQLYEINVW